MKINKNSFTLLEVVIALALFAGLAVTSVTLISRMSSSYETQNERSAHVENLVALDRTLKKMFTNMVKYSWRDEDNQRLPHFTGTSDFMRFVHLNRVNDINDGGLRFVELFLDDQGRFTARYQTRPYRNAEEMNEDAYLSILAENIASVQFDYASVTEDESSSEFMEWLQEWDEEKADIPLAVMVTLNWKDETSETFLWRTAGNGYYERYGDWNNRDVVQR